MKILLTAITILFLSFPAFAQNTDVYSLLFGKQVCIDVTKGRIYLRYVGKVTNINDHGIILSDITFGTYYGDETSYVQFFPFASISVIKIDCY